MNFEQWCDRMQERGVDEVMDEIDHKENGMNLTARLNEIENDISELVGDLRSEHEYTKANEVAEMLKITNHIKEAEAVANILNCIAPNLQVILTCLAKGEKIQAIKYIRDKTLWGLKEAADYVDALVAANARGTKQSA